MDHLTHKIGRWVINTMAISAIPLIIYGWNDREKHIEIQNSTIHRLDITNIRIDNLKKEVETNNNNADATRNEILKQLENLKAETSDINRYLRKKL